MAISRLNAFDQYLRDNLIPIDGVSGSTPYSDSTVTIQFQVSATQQQKDFANAAKAGWDWRTRIDLTRANIASTIAGLTAQQQQALQRHCIAKFILEHEDEVTRILSDLGFALPFDQVAP